MAISRVKGWLGSRLIEVNLGLFVEVHAIPAKGGVHSLADFWNWAGALGPGFHADAPHLIRGAACGAVGKTNWPQ